MSVVFKGTIGTGTVSATFSSDYSNRDADSLTAQYVSIPGPGSEVDATVIVPGGAGTVRVSAPRRGRVVVAVETGHSDESGRLVVCLNDVEQDAGVVEGWTEWSYAAVEEQ